MHDFEVKIQNKYFFSQHILLYLLFIFTEKTIKNKWRYIKDQYVVELSLLSNPKSGITESQWPLFNALKFYEEEAKILLEKNN